MAFEQHVSGNIEYLERPGSGGPVLVMLHGIGSNAASFAPLLDHLPRGWRVIAWNAPGYGGSAPLDAEWPLALDYAVALKDFLDRLELKRVLLAGHSLGCLMGAAYAAAHRERVARLLLSSPALGHGVPRGAALSAAAQARIDDLEMLGPDDFAALRAPRLVFEPEGNSDIVSRVRDGMAQVSLRGYPQAARMLASGRLIDDAERLQVPTDVIVGAKDVVTPPDSARRAYAALRDPWRGALTLVPGAGHALYQQAPAAFASALAALAETVG
jgi:pimeloyl-ACP methyl ester carboxylesterase